MTINHIPSAAIAGLHRRYDVATKCSIVQIILVNTYPTKEDLNDQIQILADLYNVSTMSIKVWCAKYAINYKVGLNLPAGVMSFTATPVQGKEIAVVEAQLADLRDKALVLKRKYHPETGSTPREILDELILDKEQ